MSNKILICHRPTTPPAADFLLQRETKNEIPWGVEGLWQIIFQIETKNEIHGGGGGRGSVTNYFFRVKQKMKSPRGSWGVRVSDEFWKGWQKSYSYIARDFDT